MASKQSQPFSVTRQAPELIVPAEPTPNEVKQLSNIDDQEGIRFHVPFIFLYRNNPSSAMKGKDPVKVIREALRVLFVEADANVSLDQLGPEIQPPFICSDELLYVFPGSDGIIGCPLLSIQVTRLQCGGFIFALRWNHTLCDAYGLMQFLKTMEQMIQGAPKPSTMPVWQRDLLTSRNPPPSVWRCRTAALQLDPNQIVRLSCLINVRNKSYNFHLPEGYYGNAFAFPAACSKAEVLCKRGLGYAVQLVKAAKAQMSGEYIRSVADLMEIKGRIKYTNVENFVVSYVKNSGFKEVDFGWGKAVYGGPTGAISLISFCMEFKDVDGKSGILMPICLPKPTMERQTSMSSTAHAGVGTGTDRPAELTPQEVKKLSDIDDQEGFRFQVLVIFLYRNNHPSPAMEGRDPVKVIREALSKALVFYYPLAGRLREGENRKLLVDCNGEGVLFIEADANFSLDELGDEIHPPFPCLGELLYNVPGSDGILGCPLLLIQVTRLLCGGFILALRLNHTMCDGYGLVQFLNAVEEMAQGKPTPSVTPGSDTS
ncbi:hypothetical protein Patl1_29411 [Pistacia atlantica]|uniref:Uncharacterized protein n=1 Tax=Pistacia atlantica TaxID=434234 RepID=A0ACC1ACT3_9ROSI|nr:hypothetical protein Patl1_29411 [Pistacia atlantica]